MWINDMDYFNFTRFTICVMLSFVFYRIISFEINIVDLCEIRATPIIFGDDLCYQLDSQNLKLTFKDNFTSVILVLFTPKPVIKTELNHIPVVLKRLATKDEFKQVDSLVKNFSLTSQMDIPLMKEKILDVLSEDFTEGKAPKLHLCPKQKTIDNFLGPVIVDPANIHEYFYIWTSLMLNPEPLICQILKPPEWPVPRYLGSCGRLAAFENSGDIISDFYTSPWILRANISHQLLVAANKFTFQHPQYGFYLTDISPDNIALDSNGIVKFVDLENMIVVDKAHVVEEYGAAIHTSSNLEYSDDFTFFPSEICNHRISDHNIFGVCKEILFDNSILPEGLLHSPPTQMVAVHHLLKKLISECVRTTVPKRRFQISKEMQRLLAKAIKNFKIS